MMKTFSIYNFAINAKFIHVLRNEETKKRILKGVTPMTPYSITNMSLDVMPTLTSDFHLR